MVVKDAQWAVPEPLIQTCRPHHKTQHRDLRQIIETIFWRCQKGAKWRSIPISQAGLWPTRTRPAMPFES